MSRFDIIRAWKDAAFRKTLTPAQQAQLPENPAGTVELTAAEASAVDGKLAIAICSSCHGCGGVNLGARFQAVINPVNVLRLR
ncbi:MAG: mersacidin/lichenicidin family type 2 lantibiotic [Gemmataceae bacterium]|nr:mersacidin/lichenicidin family type 2 lantibiotic [Gemmataceae bacterium]